MSVLDEPAKLPSRRLSDYYAQLAPELLCPCGRSKSYDPKNHSWRDECIICFLDKEGVGVRRTARASLSGEGKMTSNQFEKEPICTKERDSEGKNSNVGTQLSFLFSSKFFKISFMSVKRH